MRHGGLRKVDDQPIGHQLTDHPLVGAVAAGNDFGSHQRFGDVPSRDHVHVLRVCLVVVVGLPSGVAAVTFASGRSRSGVRFKGCPGQRGVGRQCVIGSDGAIDRSVVLNLNRLAFIESVKGDTQRGPALTDCWVTSIARVDSYTIDQNRSNGSIGEIVRQCRCQHHIEGVRLVDAAIDGEVHRVLDRVSCIDIGNIGCDGWLSQRWFDNTGLWTVAIGKIELSGVSGLDAEIVVPIVAAVIAS